MTYYKQTTITKQQFKIIWWVGVILGNLIFSAMGHVQSQIIDTPLVEGLKLFGVALLAGMIGWSGGILTKVERRLNQDG